MPPTSRISTSIHDPVGMLHFHPAHRAIACLILRMNRPESNPSDIETVTNPRQRLRVIALIVGYVALVLIAWLTRSDALSAICVVLLVSAVLSPQLRRRTPAAWLAWLAIVGGVLALSFNGQGRVALDLVPLAINLGLAVLFGWSLSGGHTPLIARAIIAIDGIERLSLPRVQAYARTLTCAWAVVFAIQVVMFVLLIVWWLPAFPIDSSAHRWAMIWLHVGGYALPAVFMLLEYVFRRWYLRHMPHAPPLQFLRQLVQNWPQLLRDTHLHTQRRP
ncbi:MAG TPA: hypothetical protein VFN25_10260 [Dokdonella sp.]|nr:hypothetical protein [Dokdonella sp.]